MKLEALVDTAVFIGGADGEFGETELNVFIDRVREVSGENASASELMFLARRARRDLRVLGREAFLQRTREKLGRFSKTEVLRLAQAIACADGVVTPQEQMALDALAAD